MKVKCKCKHEIEFDESKFKPGEVITVECPWCADDVEVTIPSNEEVPKDSKVKMTRKKASKEVEKSEVVASQTSLPNDTALYDGTKLQAITLINNMIEQLQLELASYRKRKEKIQADIAILRSNLLSLKESSSTINPNRIKQLQLEMASFCKRMEKIQADYEIMDSNLLSLKGSLSPINPRQMPSYYRQGTQPSSATSSETHPLRREPMNLYCEVPLEGVFKNLSRIRSSKSLYYITYNGGVIGRYSFIDDRDCAMAAARSISYFLDPGCEIYESQKNAFSRVRTITPGTVRKTSKGWIIESKAVVQLI